LRINHTRFLENLEQLALIGLLPDEDGGGRDRPVFSPAEREARRYVIDLASKAGFSVRTDTAANLLIRLDCATADARTLVLGSHIDTVPHGGPYDGALGVIAALEVLRVIGENGLSLPYNLEAIAFTDEEGRFEDFLGSMAVAGSCTDEMIRRFIGSTAAIPEDFEAMSEIIPGGLTAEGIRKAVRDKDQLAGYLELHIEQGPRLEHAKLPIGVVSAIFGRTTLELTFTGRPDHAGTTPMDLRADAVLAAAECVTRSHRRICEQYPEAVITFGGLKAEPGVYNVVAGRATVLVEFRAATEEELQHILDEVKKIADEITSGTGLSYSLNVTGRSLPVDMCRSMRKAIIRGAETMQYAWMEIPSGAGHDAQIMAGITPAGMIFVPSIGGRSHCPEEDTSEKDLIAGASVLLHTVLALARE